MGRASTKANKNIYQKTRESLQLTREEASEVLEGITPERIEKIENERSLPHPDEVLLMSNKYKQPSLCNYYCSNECPIGQQYVPEVEMKDLSQIVLEMLASLNSASRQKDRLIEITVDGKISGDELDDFIRIQEELEQISVTVETLQFWAEKMMANGAIDMAKLMKCYIRCGVNAPVRVDHVPTMAGEVSQLPGYDAMGRLFAIGYLKGILDACEGR